jgi:uncharacterized protein (DUF1330 family)
MPYMDWQELRRVMQRAPWTPTDCPNFLVYADKAAYRKYALGIAPLLSLGGAKVRWYADKLETLRGDSPCDTLMILRYRNHRAMLAMILLPYYQFINQFRMRGTRRLQLSFTEPVWAPETLGREPFVLGVHFSAALPGLVVREIDEAAAKQRLAIGYVSVDRQGFTFLKKPRPNDPNPLQYAQTVLIGSHEAQPLRDLAASPALAAALAQAGPVCLQLYKRESVRSILQKG